jgi:hypothetical protein
VDGHAYVIISSDIPDTSQQGKLLPYVGKLVTTSGRVFERTGSTRSPSNNWPS